jgi:hypothetical protein
MLKNCKNIEDNTKLFGYQLTKFVAMESIVNFIADFQDEHYGKDYIVVPKEDRYAIFTKGDRIIKDDVKSYKRRAYKENNDKIEPAPFDFYTARQILKGIKV